MRLPTFMNKILSRTGVYNEYGKDGLRNALKSFVGTIEYYETTGQNKPGDRAVIQRFQQILKNQ